MAGPPGGRRYRAGGRELAYVAMSRARYNTTVHVVADDLDQAAEDLVRDWSREQRPRWAIDTGTPGSRRPIEPRRMPTSVRRAVLQAERDVIAALVPPARNDELRRLEHQLAQARTRRDELARGLDVNRYPDLQAAAEQMREAERQLAQANRVLEHDLSWRKRRYWKHAAAQWTDRLAAARQDYDHLVQPHLARLDTTIADYDVKADKLRQARIERTEWLQQHPDAARRLHHLATEVQHLDTISRTENQLDRLLERDIRRRRRAISRVHGADHQIDHGMVSASDLRDTSENEHCLVGGPPLSGGGPLRSGASWLQSDLIGGVTVVVLVGVVDCGREAL